jgi:hypothetical protein
MGGVGDASAIAVPDGAGQRFPDSTHDLRRIGDAAAKAAARVAGVERASGGTGDAPRTPHAPGRVHPVGGRSLGIG